ncbi:MAG: chromosomal replication initiator protein DnaA [Thermodesulfobacteriota bacterium]
MRWQHVKDALHALLPESSFNLWIEPLACVADDGGVLELAGPDPFFCSWVRENYQARIQAVLEESGHGSTRVVIRPGKDNRGNGGGSRGAFFGEQLRLPDIPKKCTAVRTLHPAYTFDEFMTGANNALARRASESIASGSDEFGSCLYIGAGTGLGKSHLTHAVAHHILNSFPSTRLHYLTARQMTSEMVRSIKNNAMEAFKHKYHHQCDVLLLDDVHALAGKDKTQEELASTLDVLMESGKRIIITGNVPPRDIAGIDRRMRSRLSAALIAHIGAPDLTTRLLIIRHKAMRKNLPLADHLAEYMAERLKGDVRQIESAVVGLKAKSALLETVPDLDMVKEVLAGIVDGQERLTVAVIRDFLADQFKVSVTEMQSKSRRRAVAFPRQVSMYLSRKYTEDSLADIGKAFNRDHSTVVHAIRVITEAVTANTSVRGQIAHLCKRLEEKYSR